VQPLRETAIELQLAPIRSPFQIPVATLWVHSQAVTLKRASRTFGRNVNGVPFTVQKALPLLAEGASVILRNIRINTLSPGATSTEACSPQPVPTRHNNRASVRRPHRAGGHVLDVLYLVRRVPVSHGRSPQGTVHL
jgi:hypothetical protein